MADGTAFSASDLEKYGYCPLSWWLSKDDADEEDLSEGERRHAKIASEITKISRQEGHARESESAVLYFAIAATFISILGVTILQREQSVGEILVAMSLIWLLASSYFLYKAETLATKVDRLISERVVLGFAMIATVIAIYSVSMTIYQDLLLSEVLQVIALGWLIGASYFLYRSLKHLEVAKAKRETYEVRDGRIEFIDDEHIRPKMFESEKYGLRGRPDYVVLEGEYHIPVEIKTGRTPRGPLFSHILQTAAYCVLLEEEYGKSPPYGILKYGEIEHEIDYTPDLKQLVLGKLEDMRKARETGIVHRNHARKMKCVHCSRRSICPEKLA
ncbi:MAG: CRISPR-associated protein Cas4 [Thermoplasmata archaeon]|nr:CRISPR-associated protein Cas4 [Thermoplasmata archaeon]MCK4455205.1 CRISPR-associated protein Cas4 [Thermoplasmata archaeon]